MFFDPEPSSLRVYPDPPLQGVHHANVKNRHREFAMASREMTDEACRAFLAETLGPTPRSRAQRRID
jgi:hypothetical protein